MKPLSRRCVCSGQDPSGLWLCCPSSGSSNCSLPTGGCQVSTKSGLDPSGVWQAWGMASLVAGNFSGAREKLGRCLKPPVDRNQINLGPALLQEVVRQLENSAAATVCRVGGPRSFSIPDWQ